MASRANPIENVKFIDTLCRLGVSYHFEKDITHQLEKSFDSLDFNQKIRQDGCNFYTVGIVFQVFNSGSNFLLVIVLYYKTFQVVYKKFSLHF